MNRFARFSCVSIFAAGTLIAQSSEELQFESHDYGVQDSSYLFLSATDFQPFFNTQWLRIDSNDYVYCVTDPCPYRHQIELPHGALLESLRLYFYDLTLATDIVMEFCKSSVESDTGLNPARSCISTSTTAAPGYGSVLLNVNETFLTQVQLDGDPALEEVRWFVTLALNEPAGAGNLRFAGVRLKWKRQVSPAPATATFADVPTTHPFFRFVEALADAGVTGGCGGGNYCPDAPITRGQMAVFLSAALGLHWVP